MTKKSKKSSKKRILLGFNNDVITDDVKLIGDDGKFAFFGLTFSCVLK